MKKFDLNLIKEIHENPWLANLGLLFGIALVFWSTLNVYNSKPVTPDFTSNTLKINPSKQPEKQTIALENYHLFGNYIPENDENLAKPTNLEIELLGILRSDNKDQSSAIIAATGESGENYFVGDIVPGGAKLVQIYSNKVIIESNQQLETLELPGFDIG